MKNIIFLIFLVLVFSCKKDEQIIANQENVTSKVKIDTAKTLVSRQKSNFIYSKKHKPNFLVSDFDGDGKEDSVIIVKNVKNEKFGLKFHFANDKTEILGAGKDVLGQGFDDVNWIGVFEVAKKGEIYWNNVNDDGEIITEDSLIAKVPKIKLPNNSVFIHEAESCGGGIIYFDKGKFNWIQQE